MLTLTLIDIDKDEKGAPRVHFLIKRSVGYPGDRIILDKGDIKIRFSGEDRWVDEKDYNAAMGWKHHVSRLMMPEQYPALYAAAKATGWADMKQNPSENLISQSLGLDAGRFDFISYENMRVETWRKAFPGDARYAAILAKKRLGWYVPQGRVLPLGDNRDNSNDGRSFGPVKESKINGKGMIIYWPIWRIRNIK